MIVYSRSDLSRKPKYQVLTTINKTKSGLKVHKSALTKSAVAHVTKMNKSYEFLTKSKLGINICKPTPDKPGDVSFDYVNGTTLDTKFSNLVFSGELDEACKVLDSVIAFVNKLPLKSEDFSNNTEFREVFGDAYASKFEGTNVGNLDFNLDNLIEDKDKWWLIDYEWVFDFSLPIDFLISRIVSDTFWRTNDYFMLTASKESPTVSVNDRVFVSKKLFERYKKYFEQIPLVMESDAHFQNYVRGGGVPSPSIIQLDVKEFTNSPFPGLAQKAKNAKLEITALKSDLEALTKEHEHAVELLRAEQASHQKLRSHPIVKLVTKLRGFYRKLFSFRK